MPFRITLLACLGLFLLFTGCAQRETDIGANAIVGLPTDAFKVDTATATASADFDPQFSNGYGPSLQVGEARGLFAFFALRFNLPAGLPDSVALDTVRLRMHTNRIWPSSGGSTLLVLIRSITDSWTEDSILVRALAPHRQDYDTVAVLLINPIDSLFYWDVPASLWERWRAGDSSAMGLLFEPQDTGRFWEFYSAEPRGTDPLLPVQLQVRGTRWDSTDSGWNDTTLYVNLTPSADAYAVIDQTPRSPDKLMITQGAARRMALHFTLDSLSSPFTHAVNRAELHLFAAPDSATIGYSDQNILFNHGLMKDTSWIVNPTIADSFHTGYESGTVGTWNATSSEYILDVSGVVADWIAYPSGNGGLQVFADDESSFLARQVFYSHLADPDKKPKLIIWYTESSH